MNIDGLKKDNKHIYDQGIKQIKRNISHLQGSCIDPKRQISHHMKEEIWNEAGTESSFDPDIFRQDMLGNVAVKYLSYNNNDNADQLKLAYEYEHIVSHSDNGKTDKINIRILNAPINRSKGSTSLYNMNYYESKGRQIHQSVSFGNLLDALECNLHLTCKKYNLLFIKNSFNNWSIEKSSGSKNTYMAYSDEYKKKLRTNNNIHKNGYQ